MKHGFWIEIKRACTQIRTPGVPVLSYQRKIMMMVAEFF